ncbi:MAG TPA: hypothetical protein GX735_06415 [Firmicutes bacterium]|jgi:hypothetical protein|nr:hypothetical protein [Bacillota bacterium]
MFGNRNRGKFSRERHYGEKVETFGLPWHSSLPSREQEICRLYHVLDDRTGDGKGEY